ncbi:MAG: aspartate/glutamate racemase family protein [Magnetococcales bacterium]|nr:aspartate/glutamate racemase family protein [Magnetococcales bacterium]
MKIKIINPGIEPPTPPERVVKTVQLLQKLGVWHIVSLNSPATSCRDAAQRRYRLGNVGIPLHDELKSLHMIGKFPDNQTRHILFHARAHCQFNLDAARQVVGAISDLERLPPEDLGHCCGARYGTVNPCSEAERWIQVFDKGILAHYQTPHTMMTNAGDLNWAIEFHPREMIIALQKVSPQIKIADIVNQTNHTPKQLPVFGILTGNGPDSGQLLWRLLNSKIYQALEENKLVYGDLSYPRVIINSVPEMGLSMELQDRYRDVQEIVADGVEKLLHAGATHIAIACNTTPYFQQILKEKCLAKNCKFISIVDSVMEYIINNKINDITLMAIPRVAEMGDFSAYALLKNYDVIPMNPRAEQQLQELGFMIKNIRVGGTLERERNKLTHAIKIGAKTKNVLVALTEISVLLDRFRPNERKNFADKNIIDSLEIYAQHLADHYLNALIQEDDNSHETWE